MFGRIGGGSSSGSKGGSSGSGGSHESKSGGNDRCSNPRTGSYVSKEGRTTICIRGDSHGNNGQDGSYPSGHGNSRGGDGGHGGGGYSDSSANGIGQSNSNTSYSSEAINSSFTSLVQRISSPPHGCLVPEKTINLKNNGLTNSDIGVLMCGLQYQGLNLDIFDVSHNKIGYGGVENICYGLRVDNPAAYRFITTMNFSYNLLDDNCVQYIANSISLGRFPHLKVTHLEGNKFSSTGEGYLVKALLHKATQHMIIYTQSYKGQFDEHVKMIFGTREEKAAIYKKLIAQGVEKGTNDQGIVVDQTLLGEINNGIDLARTNLKTFWGFIKCNFDPIEMVKSYASDKIIAKLPKSISRLTGEIKTTEGAVTCYFEAHNDAWTSEVGISVLKHELCVMGELDFCGDQ